MDSSIIPSGTLQSRDMSLSEHKFKGNIYTTHTPSIPVGSASMCISVSFYDKYNTSAKISKCLNIQW